MSSAATFEHFESELNRLVEKFGRNLAELKGSSYDEAKLRLEFLDPLFRCLGWDMENRAGLIQQKREVEIESRTRIGGRNKRADYLFRAGERERWVCEAKKPAEELSPRYAFQAKRYAWNKGLPLAVLTDFEELKVYVVGGRPLPDEPEVGLWKTWHFRQFPLVARELWDLFSRDAVSGGAIDRLIEGLPKKAAGKGRAKQQWLIKPDRTRALDTDFLNFLDENRQRLASDLYRLNDHGALLADNRLNEAVQRILDRLLFLRISEDRDIDTGIRLDSIVETYRRRFGKETGRRARQQSLLEEPPAAATPAGVPQDSLWSAIVDHFRALDRRPASHVPFFNGNLFKTHFSEGLQVGDEWLADFIGELSDEESPYLFDVIPVEILGTIYERFLGKVVRPKGRGITVEEKPEVRKAGGVYYTPRYIVDYIVEQTVGVLVEGQAPEATLKLRILDPACGSGSFLIRAFERMCEHWQRWLTANPGQRKKKWCWVDPGTGDVQLTVDLKRRILTQNIFGVDLDAAAVEVTQLSLYLKMLENENRTTLERERELFAEAVALLPPLQDNIKCGNSLIASDFSMMPEELVRVRAFDWPVQFAAIMKSGGFDAVIGNPPYIRIQTLQESDPAVVEYFKQTYSSATRGNYDIYVIFIEQVLGLLTQRGKLGYIVPNKFFNTQYGEPIRGLLAAGNHLNEVVHFGDQQVFEGASTYTCLLFLGKSPSTSFLFQRVNNLTEWREMRRCEQGEVTADKVTASDWRFGVGISSQLMERLKASGPRLGDFTDIFVGLQTSADTVFLFKEWKQASTKITKAFSKELNDWVEIESALLKSVVRSGAIGRYWAKPEAKVLFPYEVLEGQARLIPEAKFAKLFPKAWSYLNLNKSLLANREHGKFKASGWYQLYPKNLNLWERPKLLAPYMITELSCCLDTSDTYFVNVTTGGFGIVSLKDEFDLKYLCALLNSSALDYFLRQVSTNFRGGYFAANKQFIEQLPIRSIDFSNPSDKSRHDKLVGLVDKMLALTPKLRAAVSDSEKSTLQNAVTATDRQIDALVYELYGLTPEEIELVEGAA